MAVSLKRGAVHGASDNCWFLPQVSRYSVITLYLCFYEKICRPRVKQQEKIGSVKYLVRTVPGLCSACGEVSKEIKGVSSLKPNTEERFPQGGREIPSVFLLLGGIRSNNMIQLKILKIDLFCGIWICFLSFLTR